MVLAAAFGLGFYTVLGGAVCKSLLTTMAGAWLMLGAGTILLLPSRARIGPCD